MCLQRTGPGQPVIGPQSGGHGTEPGRWPLSLRIARNPAVKLLRTNSSMSSAALAQTHQKPPVLNFCPAMSSLPEFCSFSVI